jgi:RNA polymerase sigma factor (sigma-70 family)
MADNNRTDLKKLLLTQYASLRRRLEFIAGSKENAADVLQETWLRLDSMVESGPVANPDAYLLRTATNVAIDQHRRERRHLHDGDVEELFEIPDELADPERIVAARREIVSLDDVLRELPPRRRAILLAARVDGQMNKEIAARFGISLRLVEKELNLALKHCNASMWGSSDSPENDTSGEPKP